MLHRYIKVTKYVVATQTQPNMRDLCTINMQLFRNKKYHTRYIIVCTINMQLFRNKKYHTRYIIVVSIVQTNYNVTEI